MSFWRRDKSFDATPSIPKPPAPELPPIADGLVRCKYCRHGIKQEAGPSGPIWMTPLGQPPAPGAALPIECPGQSPEGLTSTFGYHAPAN